MTRPDPVRVVVFLDGDLYMRLVRAAKDAGETTGDAIRQRLASSLVAQQ